MSLTARSYRERSAARLHGAARSSKPCKGAQSETDQSAEQMDFQGALCIYMYIYIYIHICIYISIQIIQDRQGANGLFCETFRVQMGANALFGESKLSSSQTDFG